MRQCGAAAASEVPAASPGLDAYSCNPYGESLLLLQANTCWPDLDAADPRVRGLERARDRRDAADAAHRRDVERKRRSARSRKRARRRGRGGSKVDPELQQQQQPGGSVMLRHHQPGARAIRLTPPSALLIPTCLSKRRGCSRQELSAAAPPAPRAAASGRRRPHSRPPPPAVAAPVGVSGWSGHGGGGTVLCCCGRLWEVVGLWEGRWGLTGHCHGRLYATVQVSSCVSRVTATKVGRTAQTGPDSQHAAMSTTGRHGQRSQGQATVHAGLGRRIGKRVWSTAERTGPEVGVEPGAADAEEVQDDLDRAALQSQPAVSAAPRSGTQGAAAANGGPRTRAGRSPTTTRRGVRRSSSAEQNSATWTRCHSAGPSALGAACRVRSRCVQTSGGWLGTTLPGR